MGNASPDYSTWYPPKFRQVIPFLVASLGYHKQWLIDNLHPNHPLFNSRLWTNEKFQLELIPRILSGTFYNRTGGLRATGVPCHLIIARKVEELGDQIQKQNEKFSTLLDDIPESDKNKILDHFTVNGQSLSRADAQAMLTNMRQELCDLIRNNPQQQQQAQAPLMENDDGSVVSPDGYKLFYWRGKYRYVPEFFQFPRCHLQMLWDLWWDGNPAEKLVPYRKLSPDDMSDNKEKAVFSKAVNLMKELLTGDDGVQYGPNEILSLTKRERDQVFQELNLELCKKAYPSWEDVDFDKKGVVSRKYSSIYDNLVANRSGNRRTRRRLR